MTRPVSRTASPSTTRRAPGAPGADGQHGAPCPPTGALRTGSIVDLLGRIAGLHGELAQACEALAEQAGNALADVGRLSLTRVTPVKPSTPKDPGVLRPSELAALLQVVPRTLRRMELDGRIPAPIGSGRMKRWRRADIQRWLG